MVTSLSVLVFLVSLPLTYAILEKEQSEAICSNNACYTVHLSQERFSEASTECVKRGGDLLTIQHEEEAGHVYSLLRKFTNTRPFTRPSKLWIGLHKTKSCVYEDQALRGFSWITDFQDKKEGQFFNWLTEPKKTCLKERCVSMNLWKDSPDNYKWSDGSCSSRTDGYICKFNFQGMCQRVVLAGPGFVQYDLPFSFKSSSLDLVPNGSSVAVFCGPNGEHTGPLLSCQKTGETNVYQWDNSHTDKKSKEPFCASEEEGCKYNNGGCQHECIEYPQNKSLSCKCKDGYVLAPDFVSCVYPDHCQPNPCEQNCINHQHGFKCSCSKGFALNQNQVNCSRIIGCLKEECGPRIINGYKSKELESEYNTTQSSHRENAPQTASYSTYSVRDVHNDKENRPKITQLTLMPPFENVSPSAGSVNDISGCNAIRPRSKLLWSLLFTCAIFYS
ncbi:complement component C1q receptor-like [Rhinoderma darwinii]|uniref:complement component C1q receptor-like n=1 Tax=Rhinoderma darwinii TaxID=43563 RepID=UPI003F66B556